MHNDQRDAVAWPVRRARLFAIAALALATLVSNSAAAVADDEVRKMVREKTSKLTTQQIIANEQTPFMMHCRTTCICKYREWTAQRCEGVSRGTPSDDGFNQCNFSCEAFFFLRQ